MRQALLNDRDSPNIEGSSNNSSFPNVNLDAPSSRGKVHKFSNSMVDVDCIEPLIPRKVFNRKESQFARNRS